MGLTNRLQIAKVFFDISGKSFLYPLSCLLSSEDILKTDESPKIALSGPTGIRFHAEERVFPELARRHPEMFPETTAEIGNGRESRPKRSLFDRTAVQQKSLGMSQTDRIEEMHGGTSCRFPENGGKTAWRKSCGFRKVGAAERFGEMFLHIFHDPFHFRIPFRFEIRPRQQIGQRGKHAFCAGDF